MNISFNNKKILPKSSKPIVIPESADVRLFGKKGIAWITQPNGNETIIIDCTDNTINGIPWKQFLEEHRALRQYCDFEKREQKLIDDILNF